MARKRSSRSQQSREPDPEELELDEVDEFEAAKEKILFDEAGMVHTNADSDESDQDQEVMGIDEDSSDSDEEAVERYRKQLTGHVGEDEEQFFDSGEEQEANSDEDEEAWGSRNDYYGGDNAADEEDAKLLEQEALRLQKKHLEELSMGDYMVDETVEEWKKESKDDENEVADGKSETVDISQLDREGLVDVLKNTYPEFIPLTKEYKVLKPMLNELVSSKESNEVAQIKHTALSVYLGTIATYFALFASYLKQGNQFSMKDEPVMSGILSAREVWRQAQELPSKLPELSEYSMDSDVSSEAEEVDSHHLDQFDDELSDEEEEDQDSESGGDEKEDIDFTKKRTVRRLTSKGPDYVDDVDNEDKRGRRKTLRFYTSKIDQQENKKDAKFQGDQDLPHRERLFERRQRLTEEARKRGDASNSAAPGADLGSLDDDLDLGDADFEEGADYYNNIQSAKLKNKEMRQEAHMLAKKAAREGTLAEMQEVLDDETGKRAVNYQIMKNRGLTPHRNKDNRNSRVKKRKKYAKAQKKLKSVRAVYQTPKGPYSGEATGIKKNLSKSVKLQ